MNDEQRRAERNAPPLRHLTMTHKESAYLYNLLCDNARDWNAYLRKQLSQQVGQTEAFNARVEMSGR
jgi:hypothetical protein